MNWNLLHQPDVGAVILVDAVSGIAPLPLRAVGELDAIQGIVGTPVVSVGYGLNWAKAYGSERTKGLGPQLAVGVLEEYLIAAAEMREAAVARVAKPVLRAAAAAERKPAAGPAADRPMGAREGRA